MRIIPEKMAEALAEGVTTHAHVWRFTRRDGAQFAFTDHDRALSFDGITCAPATGASPGAMEKSNGLGVDSASIAGALNAEAITEEDIARGLWDGARVDCYRVDWRDAAQRVHLFAGRIGEVRRGAQAFEAELRGLQAPLNVPVGRVFSRFCDADLGDARCGIDLEVPVHRGDGVVSSVISNTAFRAIGLEAFAPGWFARGRLVWSAGGDSEAAAHTLEGGDAVIELCEPPRIAVAPGAAFTIYAGCDKRLATCAAKFANTVNFRGFPHMPGNDAIQAGPVAGEPLDGSSRHQ
jgi:uncharacterized phage protein (TIGR02218 family)